MQYFAGWSLALALASCGGPQNKYAETPTATTPRRHTEAPAASTSDREREQLIQQFDDMRDGQQAYEEANRPAPTPPGPPPPPKKIGPAEQAPMPPKKTGPAEQAPTR